MTTSGKSIREKQYLFYACFVNEVVFECLRFVRVCLAWCHKRFPTSFIAVAIPDRCSHPTQRGCAIAACVYPV